MKRQFTVMALLAALLALGGCSETFSWRQKMTITVSTPTGEVSGSAVSEISVTHHAYLLLGKWMGNMSVRGEAVTVEVAPGKHLFALMSNSPNDWYMARLAAMVAAGRDRPGIGPDELRDVQDRVGPASGPMVLQAEFYPTFITYDDPKDPATAREVKRLTFAGIFGPGFALKSVTLEITDEPVTTGKVAALLPCVSSGDECIRQDLSRPYADPLRSTPNTFFVWEK